MTRASDTRMMRRTIHAWLVALVAVIVASGCHGSTPPRVPPPVPAPLRLGDVGVSFVPQLGRTVQATSWSLSRDASLALSDEAGGSLWDVKNGILLRTYERYDRLAISPDGRFGLAVRSGELAPEKEDDGVRLFDVATGTVIRKLNAPGRPRTVAFSPDGTHAAGSIGGTLYHWDITIPKAVFHASLPRMIAKDIRAIAFTPDGRGLVTAGEDAAVRLWDLVGNTPPRLFQGHKGPVGTITFTKDGSRLIAGSREEAVSDGSEGSVLVWNVASGAVEKHHVVVDYIPTALALFPDARRAFVSTAAHVYVIDLETGAMLAKYEKEGNASAIGVTPDGTTAVFVAADGIRHRDTVNGSTIVYRPTFTWHVKSPIFSPDGRYIITGEESTNGRIRVWDVESMAHVRSWVHEATLSSLTMTRDGRRLISSSDQGVIFWDFASGRKEQVLQPKRRYRRASMSPDGRYLIASVEPNELFKAKNAPTKPSISIWDAATGTLVRELTGHEWTVNEAVFSPDGRAIASAGDDGTLRFWDADTGNERRKIGIGDRCLGVQFAPDGKTVIIRTFGGYRVYDVATGELVTDLPNDDKVAEGHRIAWDASTGQLKVENDGHRTILSSDRISPNRKYALTTSWDSAVRMWRVDTGDSLVFTAHGDDWLVFDDRGYFDASRRGGKLAAAVRNNHGTFVEQLAVRNNRPDLMLERMGLGTKAMQTHFRARHDRRLAKLGLTEETLATSFDEAPEVQIVRFEQHDKTATLSFELTDKGGLLDHYNVYVNDVPVLGKPIKGAKAQASETVELTRGRNKIEISGTSTKGTESLRALHTTFCDKACEAAGAGTLYYVGFGVSKYKNSKYDLSYPHKDVLDLGEVLRAAGKQYRAVHVFPFVNEQATVPNLRRARDLLAKAEPDDTVIMFVSGHGLHTRDAAGDYYYATHEVDTARLSETAASFELIEEVLAGTRARKKLLLMDTCESGEKDDTPLATGPALPGARGIRARSTDAIVRDATAATPAAAGAAPVAVVVGDRERYIYNDLARRTGTIVLSSSRGGERSFELDELDNGAFTEEILIALTSGVADLDKDGMVSSDELRRYVGHGVAARTSDKQHPTVDRDNLDALLAIPIATSASGIVTRTEAPLPQDDALVALFPPPPAALPKTPPPAGCGCHTAPAPPAWGAWAFIVAVALAAWRMRSRDS